MGCPSHSTLRTLYVSRLWFFFLYWGLRWLSLNSLIKWVIFKCFLTTPNKWRIFPMFSPSSFSTSDFTSKTLIIFMLIFLKDNKFGLKFNFIYVIYINCIFINYKIINYGWCLFLYLCYFQMAVVICIHIYILYCNIGLNIIFVPIM